MIERPRPPSRLNYQARQPEPRPPVITSAVLGALAGCLVSYVAYVLGFEIAPVMVALVLVAKVVVGRGLRRNPKLRGFGIGVLLSIGLGVLIFFGVCANRISFH
jgi:hypothetical protein